MLNTIKPQFGDRAILFRGQEEDGAGAAVAEHPKPQVLIPEVVDAGGQDRFMRQERQSADARHGDHPQPARGIIAAAFDEKNGTFQGALILPNLALLEKVDAISGVDPVHQRPEDTQPQRDGALLIPGLPDMGDLLLMLGKETPFHQVGF